MHESVRGGACMKACEGVHVSSEIPGIRSAHQAAALQLKISDKEGGPCVKGRPNGQVRALR